MKARLLVFLKLVRSLLTHIPFINKLLVKLGTGGTCSARYCYSVWMRHFVLANNSDRFIPKVVAELGPGDSLGIGLCALISGAERYYALDAAKFSNLDDNIKIFDELVELFRSRSDIPDANEFPLIVPTLESYKFPDFIYTEEHLAYCLSEERINLIRESLLNENKPDNMITYIVPWSINSPIEKESIDFIYSQAVLEHVDSIEDTFEALNLWLKPTGKMSHSIDFRSHNTAACWNGHWGHSDFIWSLFKGKSSLLINREPISAFVKLIEKHNLKINNLIKYKEESSSISRKNLTERFQYLTDDDLQTATAFVQILK